MRRRTRAGIYAFSLDPAEPRVRETVEAGGRAAVLRDGWLVLLRPGRRPLRLVPAADAPVTFGGLSTFNTANALAAAAAADALGLPPARIREGLRTFALDAAANPGRLNLFRRGERLAIVDFAHNEAGLAGLLDVCRHLVGGEGTRAGSRAGNGGKVRLAFGTAGDRSDEILHNLGKIAGRGADEVVICEKRHYLRGRDLEAMNVILRRGVADAGYRREVPAYPTELAALEALLSRTRRGDVAAIMAHAERSEIFDWLERNRYRPVAGDELRELLAGRSEAAAGN